MKVLGLDVSSVSVGWAIRDSGGISGFGAWEPPKGVLLHEKTGWVSNQFKVFISMARPTKLVIEDTYFSKNVKTLKTLSYFIGAILCHWVGREPIFVVASQARKEFGITGRGKGKGKAKRKWLKAEVKRKVKERCGIEVNNDNIADAIVLAEYGYTLG